MKLECVLTACNLDPKYFEFIEYFVRAWKTVLDNVDVKVILISDHIPESINHLQENIYYSLLFQMCQMFLLVNTFVCCTRLFLNISMVC